MACTILTKSPKLSPLPSPLSLVLRGHIFWLRRRVRTLSGSLRIELSLRTHDPGESRRRADRVAVILGATMSFALHHDVFHA